MRPVTVNGGTEIIASLGDPRAPQLGRSASTGSSATANRTDAEVDLGEVRLDEVAPPRRTPRRRVLEDEEPVGRPC